MAKVEFKPGWLERDLERAARRFKEWADRPITKAQNARVTRRSSDGGQQK